MQLPCDVTLLWGTLESLEEESGGTVRRCWARWWSWGETVVLPHQIKVFQTIMISSPSNILLLTLSRQPQFM